MHVCFGVWSSPHVFGIGPVASISGTGSKNLTRAYNRRFNTMDGSACYRLGLFHEHRAEAIALDLFEGKTSGVLELEWADAMRSADACFRTASQEGVEGAAASICKLHQIKPGQRRPFYSGDEVCIHGLVSSLGQNLNGHKGVIVSHVASSGRFGVVQLDSCWTAAGQLLGSCWGSWSTAVRQLLDSCPLKQRGVACIIAEQATTAYTQLQ